MDTALNLSDISLIAISEVFSEEKDQPSQILARQLLSKMKDCVFQERLGIWIRDFAERFCPEKDRALTWRFQGGSLLTA